MKTNKSFEEAILRAHQSTEKNAEPQQEHLYAMHNPAAQNPQQPAQPTQAPLNESHSNLMQSWHNLRNLEYNIDEQQSGEMTQKKQSGKSTKKK